MTELSDGTKIKAGWIDLQYVRFAGEPEPTEPPVEPTTDTQPEPPVVNVNMGTVTASKLHIRKGPGSKYETDGAYFKGDRIEIVATETVDGTIWGQTNLGWVGMGYVRMDGIAVSTEENPAAARILSNGNTAVLGYGVVDIGKLNVRLGPGTEYEKIGTVKPLTRTKPTQRTTIITKRANMPKRTTPPNTNTPKRIPTVKHMNRPVKAMKTPTTNLKEDLTTWLT